MKHMQWEIGKQLEKKKNPQPGGYALLSNLSQNICKSEYI